MAEATVELHDHCLVDVLDVALSRAGRCRIGLLTTCAGESVRPFRRAAGSDVPVPRRSQWPRRRRSPAATVDEGRAGCSGARRPGERAWCGGTGSRRRGSPTAASSVACRRRDANQSMLHPHSRGRQVVLHRTVEVGEALDPDTGSWSYLRCAASRRRGCRSCRVRERRGLEGRPPGQVLLERRSSSAAQARCSTSAVRCGRRTRRVDARPVASAQLARDQQVVGAGFQHLAS